jgi:hypothetical protein
MLPTANEAHYTVSRAPDASCWGCAVMSQTGDGAATFYGIVAGQTPLKALARAVNIVEGREPASLLVQLPAEEWADVPRQLVVSVPD